MLFARRLPMQGKLTETSANFFQQKDELLPFLFVKRFHDAGEPAAIGRTNSIKETLACQGQMNSDQAPVYRIRAALNQPILLQSIQQTRDSGAGNTGFCRQARRSSLALRAFHEHHEKVESTVTGSMRCENLFIKRQ